MRSYGMIQAMIDLAQTARRRRSLLRLVSVVAAGGLVLTGCVSGPHDRKTGKPTNQASTNSGNVPPSKMRALQSRTFQTSGNTTLQVDVLSLARLGSDKLKLQLRISNLGDQELFPGGTFSNGGNLDDLGFFLIDGKSMKAYFPLVSTQGTAMQAGYSSHDGIESGGSIYPSIFFPAPPGATVANIASPSTPPFTDIPIRGNATIAKGEPNPNRVQLKQPDIENLTNITDDLNGYKSTDQSGDRVEIRLNTDVLFALNKAELSSKAKAILKDVANEIDKAKTTSIKVDGYTDSSGNDAINNPLSRRRAEAVASELKKLVSRSGVTYKTAGHGSADPVATNDTSEGRQKNRRVTVTIEE